jgi:hypothetical protein
LSVGVLIDLTDLLVVLVLLVSHFIVVNTALAHLLLVWHNKINNHSQGRSFVDDLSWKPGTVSMKVALCYDLLRFILCFKIFYYFLFPLLPLLPLLPLPLLILTYPYLSILIHTYPYLFLLILTFTPISIISNISIMLIDNTCIDIYIYIQTYIHTYIILSPIHPCKLHIQLIITFTNHTKCMV